MGYINRDKIRIFPSSNRIAPNRAGTNWVTEYNLANTLNQFFIGSDQDGFVLYPHQRERVVDDTYVKFVIAGYYFEAKASDIKSAATSSLSAESTTYIEFKLEDNYYTATISLHETAGADVDISYNYLAGEDGNGQAQPSEPTESTKKTLKLFDTSGNVPLESRSTLSGFSLKVDDGLIS